MKRIVLLLSCLILCPTTVLLAQANEPTTTTATSNPTITNSATPSEGTSARTTAFVLHGRIIDAETEHPLSFASVSINQLGLGTASNQDGIWSLQVPASGANANLHITFMGYTTKVLNIAEMGEETTIRLHAKSFQMADIIVVPHDFIKDFLAKAYKAIPENYPTKPTLCDGFYRETQRVNDSLFLYFNEAVLNVYKNTYKNPINFGQIRVEKSRKNVFPGIDTINDVRFYGGPHFPNDLDIVFSRWDFIKPSEYKNWTYELAGAYKDSITSVYTITFKNKKAPNSNFQGRMFIDRDSYAYIGFELRRAGLSTVSSAELPTDRPYIPGNTTANIGYIQQNGKYNLSYISYKSNGINTTTKTRVYKDIEYVTTAIQKDSVSPIPFDQQFDYTDILSIEAQSYDSSYWKDYNILEQSKILDKQTNLLYQEGQAMQQLTKVYNKELTDQEKTLLFLKRFTFDGGIAFHPIQYQGGMHTIYYGSNSAGSAQSVSSKYFGLSTMDGIRFELNKKISLVGTVSTALYGIEQVQFDLGANYRMSLAPSGRWIFLDLGLAASSVSTKLDICSLDNTTGNMAINGKTFDSETIDVKAGQSGYGLKPIVGISVRMGKRYELFTDGSYFLPLLFSRKYVQFKETDGFFLSRKSTKVDWDDANLHFMVDGQAVTSPRFEVMPYQFRLGIRSGF
jgi:hypothetical protein